VPGPPLKPAARKRATAGKAVSDGAPTRPTAGRRSPEDVQARILDAATHEFSEHGFAGARIDRISTQAKTVDRMLYYYFGNKERLYQAVFERVFAQMIEAERDFQVHPDDPAAGMALLIEHTWNHYVSHPELVRLLMNENLLRGKQIKKSGMVREVSLPLIERVESLLVLGRRKGLFRTDMDSRAVLMSIMSMGFFYVSNQYTCSEWMRVDLMEQSRRDSWLEHMKLVILGMLSVGAAPGRKAVGKAVRSRPSPVARKPA
jgi:AcrR family transcriptional regulator